MGHDYALVHLRYTIPPAILLTLVHRPLSTKLDFYKVFALVLVAVVSTVPWDSYLIHREIWTYPPDAVMGLLLFSIPIEEVFFMAIQTYTTAMIYILLNKSILHPAYLLPASSAANSTAAKSTRTLGQILLTLVIGAGVVMVYAGQKATYLGLILIWAGPFILLIWSLGYQFITALPARNIVAPIAIPTLYLWYVDTVALRKGTWTIEAGTKLGAHLWPGLEFEEAFFFLVTNALIVLGQVGFDHAMAILHTHPAAFPDVPELPPPALLLRALRLPEQQYDHERVIGITQASKRLERKSRSFHLASATFQGRLRIDLILLIADDLIDDAASFKEAKARLEDLRSFLDAAYREGGSVDSRQDRLRSLVKARFPPDTHAGLLSLPASRLSPGPLYDLLKGFEMDLCFGADDDSVSRWPIDSQEDLMLYGLRVAGTVAELCLDLVFHHAGARYSASQRQRLVLAGRNMGIALQLVNIARDVAVDARLERVYLPRTWLQEAGLTPDDILRRPNDAQVEQLRDRLLRTAESIYSDARTAIEELPANGRRGMRVAVESYMEIGRVLQEKAYSTKAGKASVPLLRRLRVAWLAALKP